MNTTILLKPRVSEKTFAVSQNSVYVFDVPTSSNKTEIAKAVTSTYGVAVESVKTITIKGKAKRFYRKGKFENGTRSDIKKAYVTLKNGAKLPIFEAIEEQIKNNEDSKATKSPVDDKPKRGIFGRSKVAKSAGVSTTVKRTQAKVGEK